MKTQPLDIIKLGGSVLTNKKKYKTLRKNKLKEICSVIATYNYPLILVHGAGSFGHIIANKYSIVSGYSNQEQLKALAIIRQDMDELSMNIINCFLEHQRSIIKFQASAIFYFNRERVEMFIHPIIKALELGIIPLLAGDIVFKEDNDFSIISGDKIIREFAKALPVERVVFITDVDGVEIEDKDTGKRVIIEELSYDQLSSIRLSPKAQTDNIDVTGAMKGKLTEIKEMMELGVKEVVIVNGNEPNRLERVLKKEKTFCTRITKG